MRRALLVTAGTVAGVVAALAYTPVAASSPEAVSALDGLGELPGLPGAAPGTAPAVTEPAAAPEPPAPAATEPPGSAAAPAAPPPAGAPAGRPTTKAPAPATTPAPAPTTSRTPARPAATPSPTRTTPRPRATTPAPRPTTPAPRTTPTPTPAPTTKPSGDFTGAAARAGVYGSVQVQVRVADGVITAVAVPAYPRQDPKSVTLSAQAIPVLTQEALSAQSASIAVVSGASYTSTAFIKSLQSALKAAGL